MRQPCFRRDQSGWKAETVNGSAAGGGRENAVEYLRVSTDHQKYSLSSQRDCIARFAADHGYDVVGSYVDSGRSGVKADNRPSLRRLIDDILNYPIFSVILVYDVSRWGRFQDADESAYYEYICRRAGVKVIYCAENFMTGDPTFDSLLKSIKRVMAGEYSRELSRKVYAAQLKLVQDGYWSGGVCGYAIRRLLVGLDGEPKGVLGPGMRKSLQSDRVILIPGPAEEIAIVTLIFRLAAEKAWSAAMIARSLNENEVAFTAGKKWTRGVVAGMLTNEKYIGVNVYGRVSTKLKAKAVRYPPDKWLRVPNAFEPIVDRDLFLRAQVSSSDRALRHQRHLNLGKTGGRKTSKPASNLKSKLETKIKLLTCEAVDWVYRAKNADGWIVIIKIGGSSRAKYFADARFGSAETALSSANAFVEAIRPTVTVGRKAHAATSLRSNNSSGTPGVTRSKSENRSYWVAYWTDIDSGKRCKAQFSVRTYGEEGAKALADQYRCNELTATKRRLEVCRAEIHQHFETWVMPNKDRSASCLAAALIRDALLQCH